jgi:hypothetical protein
LAVRQNEQMDSRPSSPSARLGVNGAAAGGAAAGTAAGIGAPQVGQNFFPGATSREQEGQFAMGRS